MNASTNTTPRIPKAILADIHDLAETLALDEVAMRLRSVPSAAGHGHDNVEPSRHRRAVSWPIRDACLQAAAHGNRDAGIDGNV